MVLVLGPTPMKQSRRLNFLLTGIQPFFSSKKVVVKKNLKYNCDKKYTTEKSIECWKHSIYHAHVNS